MTIANARQALASSHGSRRLDEQKSALTHFHTSEVARNQHACELEAFYGEGDRIFHAD